MKNLYQFLPSPAPDYAGVSSLLFEMDVLTVFLDPHGCNGQTLYYSEPRFQSFNTVPKSFSFSVTEIDAIKGIDLLLIQKIKNALLHISAKAIALVGGPVSTIISTDLSALEKKLEKETGLPVFSVSTTGLDTYEVGQKKLLFQLINKFTNTHIISPHSSEVHILGATPLDGWDDTSICEYIDLFKSAGADSVVCWGHGGDLNSIASVHKANLLVATSASGLFAADMLSKKYKIPYIVGFPVGTIEYFAFFEALKNFFLGMPIEKNPSSLKCTANALGKTALIIADQINANAMRSCLINEFGYRKADIISLFSLDPNFACEGDSQILSEHSITEFYTTHGPYDSVIGDPIYQSMLPENVHFIPCPHPGLSGILYWDDCFSYFGKKGTQFFSGFLL